jgi:hypothetical protein
MIFILRVSRGTRMNRHMKMNSRNALIFSASLLLAACGGGGGGGGVAAITPDTPITVDPDPNVPSTVTLSWIAPAMNEDGTTLTDLSAFRIYTGTHPNAFTFEELTTLDNPGLASFVVENLESGPHYFSITAINSADVESEMSNVAGVTIE